MSVPSDGIGSLPQSDHHEKLILGAMVREGGLPGIERLTPEHFVLPGRQELFRRLLPGPIDSQELAEQLIAEGKLDFIGGMPALGELYGVPPLARNLPRSIEILEDRKSRRDAIALAKRLEESAIDVSDSEAFVHVLAESAELARDSRHGIQGGLLDRALSLSYDPNTDPPEDEVRMMLGEVPVAAVGNLSVIQGKSKVGKSAVIAAVLGAAQRGTHALPGDTLSFTWAGDDSGAILHLDTEQSPADWHRLVNVSVTRSGLTGPSERLLSMPLVQFSRRDRFEILRLALEREERNRGGIAAVIVDGVADLVSSPNDEAESLEAVSRLLALAHEFRAPFFCVLHENPGTDFGKTRGHLGSELNRKAFANLRIDKDPETSVSTIYGLDMRKRDLPKEQGFCFAWDDDAGMHTFQGRAAGLKAAMKEAQEAEKSREYWEPIFDLAASETENRHFPFLSVAEAIEFDSELNRNGKPVKADTMRKRLEKAEVLDVLRKAGRGVWQLSQNGKSGNDSER